MDITNTYHVYLLIIYVIRTDIINNITYSAIKKVFGKYFRLSLFSNIWIFLFLVHKY